jgi:regulator of cell morphogenesis and NO signaling
MLAHTGNVRIRAPSRHGIVNRLRSNTMITTGMTVREVAIELPQATRLFEKFKIDYCCGGNQPLVEACTSAGVDVDNVMAMLAEVSQSISQVEGTLDFQNASLPALITHIVDTHHVFTKSEMERLQSLADKVLAAHGGNHPELIHLDELFTRLCADLKPHMFKEEQILFPYIVGMAEAADQKRAVPFAPFGTVKNPVRMMMREHDTAGEILREMRVLTSDYTVPADACISYQTLYQALENFEKDLHQHIHLENNILFPKAVDLERT